MVEPVASFHCASVNSVDMVAPGEFPECFIPSASARAVLNHEDVGVVKPASTDWRATVILDTVNVS